MLEVNVTLLRERLPEYLARVERGESVRVTRHGKAVAEIHPLSVPEAKLEDIRTRLRGSLVRYDDPFGPAIAEGEWDMNQ